MEKQKSPMILVTLVLLGVYNLVYWLGKVIAALAPIHEAINKHWKLITFLEFLAVASVAVDIIVRWDTFSHKGKRMRLIITAAIGLLFMLKLLVGVIELYMRGTVS